jgi:hypothetical protein
MIAWGRMAALPMPEAVRNGRAQIGLMSCAKVHACSQIHLEEALNAAVYSL